MVSNVTFLTDSVMREPLSTWVDLTLFSYALGKPHAALASTWSNSRLRELQAAGFETKYMF
jgi:hypothetical protein